MSEVKQVNYKEILEKFKSSDVDKIKITDLHNDGTWVWATDAHIAARVPSSLISKEVPAIDGYPDIQKVWDDYFNPAKWVGLIKISDFEAALSEVEHEECFDECGTCGGGGEIYCAHCRNWNDCKVCDGTGEGKLLGYAPVYEARIEYQGNYASARYIKENIIDVAKKIGVDELAMRVVDMCFYFFMGEMEIVLIKTEGPKSKKHSAKLKVTKT